MIGFEDPNSRCGNYIFISPIGMGKQRKVASCSKVGPCGVQGDDIKTCGWSYTFGNSSFVVEVMNEKPSTFLFLLICLGPARP